jgi:DNA-binding HxlR family transcriptional regulator
LHSNDKKVTIMNTTIRDIIFPDCPIRNVLSRIGDKWSILTLYTLSQNKVLRFKELQRALPDISQKMLTITLRTLEEDGLVIRKVYAQIPPKVEYSLTGRAETLMPHIYSLIDWAEENMAHIIEDRTTKHC